MKESLFNSKLAEIKNKMTIWMMIAVVMGASNFLLVVFLFMLQSPEKTIIVPNEVRNSFWVKGNQVSPEYYSEMADFFVGKLLSYNSANAEGQFADVLKFMDPIGFNVMQGKLKAEAADIKSKNMSSAFYQQEIIPIIRRINMNDIEQRKRLSKTVIDFTNTIYRRWDNPKSIAPGNKVFIDNLNSAKEFESYLA